MNEVVVVIGPGQIGQAIARRVGVGKHVLLADMRPENANAAAVLASAGYDVSVATVDASSLRRTSRAHRLSGDCKRRVITLVSAVKFIRGLALGSLVDDEESLRKRKR